MDRSWLLRTPDLGVPHFVTPHPRALFFPLYRTVLWVATWLVGIGLWVVGAKDAPPLGWPAKTAWVPFVVLAFFNTKWHRQAERDATNLTR